VLPSFCQGLLTELVCPLRVRWHAWPQASSLWVVQRKDKCSGNSQANHDEGVSKKLAILPCLGISEVSKKQEKKKKISINHPK